MAVPGVDQPRTRRSSGSTADCSARAETRASMLASTSRSPPSGRYRCVRSCPMPRGAAGPRLDRSRNSRPASRRASSRSSRIGGARQVGEQRQRVVRVVLAAPTRRPPRRVRRPPGRSRRSAAAARVSAATWSCDGPWSPRRRPRRPPSWAEGCSARRHRPVRGVQLFPRSAARRRCARTPPSTARGRCPRSIAVVPSRRRIRPDSATSAASMRDIAADGVDAAHGRRATTRPHTCRSRRAPTSRRGGRDGRASGGPVRRPCRPIRGRVPVRPTARSVI